MAIESTQNKRRKVGKEIFLLSNGDLREEANQACWPTQQRTAELLEKILEQKFAHKLLRAHPYREDFQHGFISHQRQGCDVMANLDEQAPLIILITAWQYSHHLASSLLHHRGPILLLANFDGTWPGLVGMLNMAGSLTSLGIEYSRLWSVDFDDDFFYDKMGEWLETSYIKHQTQHVQPLEPQFLETAAAKLGSHLASEILRKKEIMGLFDIFCMGMINGVFPQALLAKVGMPMEGLSQSALLHEMSLVDEQLREECLRFYEERGMNFHYGEDEKTELTRSQVKQQCAMLIATARICERFGLTAVGIQYQQGLKDCCPASDFVEGALGSSERFPIPDYDGKIIRPGEPIPHINEVDMGSAIPQIMLFRLLQKLGLPSETTLHDVRWGSEYQGVFYWDFEISGSVPFEHIHGGIAAAHGYRQPPMYFPLGGSTLAGQCKAGPFIWTRAFYQGDTIFMHIGSGQGYLLPEEEFQRRLKATTPQWPLLNATLDGLTRDQMMAAHQSNHLSIAYVAEERLSEVLQAFAALACKLGMEVSLVGSPRIGKV